VFGALLVTAAFVAAYSVTQQPPDDPGQSYVIATSAISAGELISADDLGIVTLTLDSTVDERAFNQPSTLVGAVAVAPLSPGDLVQQSDVREGFEADVVEPVDQLTLVAPEARTPPGLSRGETIMILATFGSGTEAATIVVAAEATVVDIRENENPLTNGGPTITVAIASRTATIDTANAAANGELTLVRASEHLDGPTAVRVQDQLDREFADPIGADSE
jgi:hypothetical protein